MIAQAPVDKARQPPKGLKDAVPESMLRRAERRLRERATLSSHVLPEANARALAHELQVHQIELEMQNEELQRALAETRQAAEKYNRLFEFAPVGYFVLDQAGRVREVNLAGATLLGLERQWVNNQLFAPYVIPEAREEFQAFCHDVWLSDVPCLCTMRLIRPGGDPCSVSMEGVVIVGDAVLERRCLLMVRDITERRHLEEELLRQVEELRAKSAELARFNRVLVDRELRMIELKKEVNEFCVRVGEKKRYPLAFEKR